MPKNTYMCIKKNKHNVIIDRTVIYGGFQYITGVWLQKYFEEKIFSSKYLVVEKKNSQKKR